MFTRSKRYLVRPVFHRMTSQSKSNTIGSVETTFSIINQLQTDGSCGVTELADKLGIPKSTVYKHLQTLSNIGYVRADNGTYQLGLKFLEHGGWIRDRCRIYVYGRSKVESLANTVNEMVVLSIRDEDRGVFLFNSNDQYNLQESIPLGKRFYLHQTAAGKAMLAALDDEPRRRLLNQIEFPPSTAATITDREELITEIETVQQQGFALNHGERDPEIQAVAAPVYDYETDRVGAISISTPTESPNRDALDNRYADDVKRVASKLSLQLKYSS